jgi:hypothetical protein
MNSSGNLTLAVSLLDTAIEDLQQTRRLLDPPGPVVKLPDAVALPQTIYKLPRETNTAISAFYGPPSKNPSYLEWFSFPTQTLLYSRTGADLSNRVGDSRDDHRTHRLLATRLESALAQIYLTLGHDRYIKEGWHVYGGSHNYRTKTGGSSLSTHAWGAAVDMCPSDNTYQQRSTTFSIEAINIMESYGFLSGGRAWGKDWMHFQAIIPSISAGSYYATYGLPKNILAA